MWGKSDWTLANKIRVFISIFPAGMATLKMHKLKITFKLISEINRGRVEEGKGETVSECDAIQLNLACQKRINNVVSLCLAAALYSTFAFVWFYVLPLPLCVRVTMCTQHESKGIGGRRGECSLLIAVCLLIFIASDDPPRDRQQQILMLFSCSYFTCNHTQPPGPGPDLVTAPGLHTRTRAETYTLTHKCRENESQVSWLFTLRFLRYS